MQKTWVFDLGVIIVLWQYIGAIIGQKIRPLRSFEPELSLQLVQSCVSSEYLMNAIFAKAWVVVEGVII